jgi:ferredoxin
MDFAEDIIRVKLNEIPEESVDRAKQSIKDCAVTAISLEK